MTCCHLISLRWIFLKELNASSKVVLVFLGKEINGAELAGFSARVNMYENNDFTQKIAASKIFGAYDQKTARLAYAMPEMQGMDSRTLEKIDDIVQEAIAIGATPGCQVLVVKGGSVVMEKGYGYYTYDSIMAVDTRTMYDLASVTKVCGDHPGSNEIGRARIDTPRLNTGRVFAGVGRHQQRAPGVARCAFPSIRIAGILSFLEIYH
jgi:hypothetical protein